MVCQIGCARTTGSFWYCVGVAAGSPGLDPVLSELPLRMTWGSSRTRRSVVGCELVFGPTRVHWNCSAFPRVLLDVWRARVFDRPVQTCFSSVFQPRAMRNDTEEARMTVKCVCVLPHAHPQVWSSTSGFPASHGRSGPATRTSC